MWAAVLVGAAACYGIKLAGLSVPERVLADARVRRVAALLPVALLAALIALQAATDGRAVAVDARLAGLAVAVGAQWRRAPFLVVVGAACATTALVRLVT
ncbi:AzlD domain-containing protein [Iamia sp. SCSIO 61187]|uniref:AzlD domain-containing protein n=1 Tax=Iamia sp. SCSIO 61187 TaxID=2722752 RepID=UPI001C63082C|nr:AzlD domain-containing protein [Iamia sp. SCSIO 61187]QYG92909.1 AzlD domain-containing protein [Iamia sp. SCSIO 61187]